MPDRSTRLRLGLVFGGPSEERGISLNSARSALDHIEDEGVEVTRLVYVDRSRTAWLLSRGLLYSNTPSDFDFKLAHGLAAGRPLAGPEELAEALAGCDLVFPAMHGAYGEDGEIQALFEEQGIRYVGSGPEACRAVFDKMRASESFSAHGVPTIPTTRLPIGLAGDDARATLEVLIAEHGEIVVKPAEGGSSLGVTLVSDAARGAAALRGLVARHGAMVAQPRVDGVELTTIVIEGPDGPVALPPVEIELKGGGFLDYRRKYLASADTALHCPPRWDLATTQEVRASTERFFGAMGLRDFARIDGWRLRDGSLLYSDVNPISGMEQTSFLFVAAAQAGMDHNAALRQVLRSACRRHGLPEPATARASEIDAGRPVRVLFGGGTAERQVSVLSGTNAWLKLAGSHRYTPSPYFLARDWRGAETRVWRLSQAAALHHSAEEIEAYCETAGDDDAWTELEARRRPIAVDARARLGLDDRLGEDGFFRPAPETLGELLRSCRRDGAILFLGLHGGPGEDGTIQTLLQAAGVPFNGSGPEASALCMDKHRTGEVVAGLGDPAIRTAPRWRVDPRDLATMGAEEAWERAVGACGGAPLLVKPLADGCSAGVLRLEDAGELGRYVDALLAGVPRIGGGFASVADGQVVEMPPSVPRWLLLERFVVSDDVRIVAPAGGGAERLEWQERTGWLEVTVGVLGHRGEVRALTPSLTIARDAVLSLEEKFMGGTGVNITPPPTGRGLVSQDAIAAVKARVARVAGALGIEGYARIDAFMERRTGEIIVIEANSLPGLTPATVLFHQGLAEEPPLDPRGLLEEIVRLAGSRLAEP